MIVGGGLEAVVVVVAESLVVLGSRLEELTVAALLITVPSTTEQFTLATKVIVSVSPDASDANVTVRLLPEPLQTPPPVEEQETKVVSAGRLSVKVTDVAGSGPLFVTITVKVRLSPAITGSGELLLVTERSAAGTVQTLKKIGSWLAKDRPNGTPFPVKAP